MPPDERCAGKKIDRQAIVIIHGIGEQRPLGTLKSFVRSFRPEGTFYSKPERLTSSFEARRIKLRRLEDGEEGENWIETDFFEYYWAHEMFGSRWRHFLLWAGRVLLRAWRASGKSNVAQRQLHHARVISIRKWLPIACAMVIVVGGALIATFGLPVVAGALLILLFLVLLDFSLDSVLLRVVGDVSRYLDVAPRNIARRRKILQGGIELLQSLHAERSDLEDGQPGDAPYVYDRVVVVGHSLGSVIAYDLIKHYWARVNRYLTIAGDFPALTSLESTCPTCLTVTTYQDLQFKLWNELGRSRDTSLRKAARGPVPPRWLITDLVTLGSPLTYGAVLLSDSGDEFCEKTRLRELPTCPPNRSVRDRPGGFAVHLRYEAAVHDSDPTLVLHHAAPFALTRWTNLFFAADPIAGQLSAVFGRGIRDLEVNPAPCFDRSGWLGGVFKGLKLHTQYWRPFPNYLPELLKILKETDRCRPCWREDGTA